MPTGENKSLSKEMLEQEVSLTARLGEVSRSLDEYVILLSQTPPSGSLLFKPLLLITCGCSTVYIYPRRL
jgi:hypothetical protein